MATKLETPYWPSKLTKYSVNRLKGMNMSESAREAGFSPALQNQACVRIEPKHNESIKSALQAVGVTNVRLAEVIEAGLEAKKHVKDIGQVVDYKERRETAKLCLEATGELKTGTTALVQINFPAGLADMFTLDAGEFGKED
jgi:hypothetical protein